MTYTRRGDHRRGYLPLYAACMSVNYEIRPSANGEIVGERETFIEAVCGLSTPFFFLVNVTHGRGGLHDDAKYLIASRDSLIALKITADTSWMVFDGVNKINREKPPSCLLLLLWISSNSRPSGGSRRNSIVWIDPVERFAPRSLWACFISWRNLTMNWFGILFNLQYYNIRWRV